MDYSEIDLTAFISYVERQRRPDGPVLDQLAAAVAAGDRIHEVADQLVGHFVQRHGPPGSPGRKSGPDWE
jgi:hypothetical protein